MLPLLLPGSVTFKNSELIDQIRQSIIELHLDPPKEQIKALLNLSLSYLDEDLNQKTLKELIILIFSCFSKFSEEEEEKFFNEICEKSQQNENRLIFFAMILTKIKVFLSFPQSIQFIKNCMKQIYSYIQNSNKDFIIFGIKIDENHKMDFICNIILSTKLTEKVISNFFPYIFSQKNLSKEKKDKLIRKVQKANLIESIPSELLFEMDILKLLSQESLSVIIPKMNDKAFIQFIPVIKEIFSEEYNWEKPFLTVILDKCVEFDVDFNLINDMKQVFDCFDVSMMKTEYWDYFAKNDVILPEQISSQISQIPDKSSLLKIMPSIENIPFNLIVHFLLETDDFEIFERASNLDLNSVDDFKIDVCSEIEFWIHIFNVISNSKVKYSKRLLIFMSKLFENNINGEHLYETFYAMIFEKFPTSHYGNYFLYDLLNEFGIDYNSNFIQSLDLLLTKIIDMKHMPLPSFWLLFDFDFISQFYEGEKTNPLILCAYNFSFSSCHSNRIEKIKIENSLSESNKELIVEFIKSGDFSNLFNLDDQMISFISSIEIFASQIKKPEIEGLNEDTILPFIALSLHYLDEFGGNLLIESNEINNLFLTTCELVSKNGTPYKIDCINSIISFGKYVFNNAFFPSMIAFRIFDIFINQYIDQTYRGDKLALLTELISLQNQYSSNVTVQNLFDKNGINLIKFYIQNMQKTEDLKNLNKINLKQFNQEILLKFLNEMIQNPSHIIKTINFVESFCENLPKLKNTKLTKFIEIANMFLEANEINNFILLTKFIMKNTSCDINSFLQKIKISNRNINDFISVLLNVKHIETQDLLFEILFNIMMRDDSLKMAYISALLEKINNSKYYIEPIKIIEYYFDEYSQYGKYFLKVINETYGLHLQPDLLIKKFRKISFKYSKDNEIIVNKLLKELNSNRSKYQVLFCLKYIVSTFPFLFDKDPTKLFVALTPVLESFSLAFLENNEKESEDNQMINNSILAQSIIFSSLYSVKVLESFIPWVLENINNFSYSVAYSYILILESLFSTRKIQDIMLSLSSKHELHKIVTNLLNTTVKGSFGKSFNNHIYEILNICYSNLNALYHTKKIIMIKEIAKPGRNAVEDMFNNNLTIYPIKMKPLNLQFSNNKFNEYIKNINEPRSFWINRQNISKQINYKAYNNFFLEIKKIKFVNFKKLPNFEIQSFNEVSDIKYYAGKLNWIYEYFVNKKTFPLLKEHHDIIEATLMRNKFSVNNNDYYDKIDLPQFFIDGLFSQTLNDRIIREFASNRTELLSKLFKEIIQCKSNLNFLSSVNNFILNNYCETEMIQLIMKFFSNDDIVYNIEKNPYSFIDFALTPEVRNDLNLISFIIKNFNISGEIPLKATHIIGFSLIHDLKNGIKEILAMCKKIGRDNLDNIINILGKSFDEFIKDKSTPNEILLEFIDIIPSFITKNLNLIPLVLDKFSERIRRNENKLDSIESFCNLFNVITPERNDTQDLTADDIDLSFNRSMISSRSSHNSYNNDYSILKKVPENLIDANPQFWDIYMKNREVINGIISSRKQFFFKFKVFSFYPELTSFEFRNSYFRQNMKKNYLHYGTLRIEVSRSNILVDSFGRLNNLSRDDWLRSFQVKFLGECGIDAGGLTKEWFTLVTQELFNPNFALFILSENKSYQPNPFSGINQEHIEYFKFAGKLIARALIQGQCVNAHFTQSFRRQILQTKLKLNDYEDIDKNTYNSMKSILENDVEPLYLNFTITNDEFGEIKTVPLKENGENIDVTNENKSEYVSLFINYRLRKSIINQVNAFCEGFNWLIPHNEIKCFSQNELDLMICGIPKIDLNDLKQNIEYEHPYNSEHRVIKMFFNVLSKWKYDDLAKLLLFITGSSQVPVNGFRDYKENGKPIKITIISDKNRFCVAHTCFNTLDLPEYDNEKVLNEKLLYSIQECEFGIA